MFNTSGGSGMISPNLANDRLQRGLELTTALCLWPSDMTVLETPERSRYCTQLTVVRETLSELSFVNPTRANGELRTSVLLNPLVFQKQGP